jgi:hypothetical protein
MSAFSAAKLDHRSFGTGGACCDSLATIRVIVSHVGKPHGTTASSASDHRVGNVEQAF